MQEPAVSPLKQTVRRNLEAKAPKVKRIDNVAQNVDNFLGKRQTVNQNSGLSQAYPFRIEPIICLWLLRLLVPLQCHRKFIGKNSYENEELAGLLSLHNPFDDDDEDDVESSLLAALSLDKPDINPNPDLADEDWAYTTKQALQDVQRRHAELERNLSGIAMSQPLYGNILALARQVGLSRVECAILAFTVLIHTNRLLGQVCYWLGRELDLPKIYHSLSVFLGYSEDEIRQALSTRSTLAKTGLVKLDRHRPNDLKHSLDLLSDGFAEKILSEQGSPLEWLRDMIVVSPAPQLCLSDYPHLSDNLDLMLAYLSHSIKTKRNGVNVLVYGAPGTGKTQLTRVLAEQLGMPLYEITSEDDDGDPIEGERRLRACQSGQAFFAKAPALMVFDEVEDVFNDGDGFFGKKSTAQTRKAWMNRMLEANPAPTFWLGNCIHSIDPAFIRRFDWVLEVTVPPKNSANGLSAPPVTTYWPNRTSNVWLRAKNSRPPWSLVPRRWSIP